MNQRPLIVDLDGTLVDTDMLHELAVKLFSERPLEAFRFPLELRKGRAHLKQYICSKTNFDAALLPYNKPLLAWLREQAESGRHLVLCTASDQAIAQPIADHLQIFNEVMASDGELNLSGRHKAQALIDKFASKGFDYCGNAKIDLLVWEHAHNAIAVNASDTLMQQAADIVHLERHFDSPRDSGAIWRNMLHHYGWATKLVPLLVVIALSLWWASSYAASTATIGLILYVGVCALPMYKDLATLEKNRRGPTDEHSLFATGKAPIAYGVATVVAAAAITVFAALLLFAHA